MKNIFLICTFWFLLLTVRSQSTTVLNPSFTAVALAYTTDSAMVFLKGSATIDSRSLGLITYKWYFKSGTVSPLTIDTPDSLGTRVRGLVPGSYNFGFIVNDRRENLSDTAFAVIIINKP